MSNLNIDLTNISLPRNGPAEIIINGLDFSTSSTGSSTRSSCTEESSTGSSTTRCSTTSSSFHPRTEKKEKKEKKDRRECEPSGIGNFCSVNAPIGNIRQLQTFSVCSQAVNTQQLVVNGQYVNPDIFLPPSLALSSLFGADSSAPPQKALTLSNEVPIPQGVYTGTTTYPVITAGLLPNYFALMSTENTTVLANWQRAVKIYSEVIIKNSSSSDSYSVGYLLMVYSRNVTMERLDTIDMDIRTLDPGATSTFRVDWFTGKSTPTSSSSTVVSPIITSTRGIEILLTGSAKSNHNYTNLILPTVDNPCLATLPFISGAVTAAIFTAVALVGTSSDLSHLRTYALAPVSLRRNILLYYRSLPSCGDLCTSTGCVLCNGSCPN